MSLFGPSWKAATASSTSCPRFWTRAGQVYAYNLQLPWVPQYRVSAIKVANCTNSNKLQLESTLSSLRNVGSQPNYRLAGSITSVFQKSRNNRWLRIFGCSLFASCGLTFWAILARSCFIPFLGSSKYIKIPKINVNVSNRTYENADESNRPRVKSFANGQTHINHHQNNTTIQALHGSELTDKNSVGRVSAVWNSSPLQTRHMKSMNKLYYS